MSKLLVTGGAGFIGSHLCEALLALGHDVIALDNFDDFYDPAVKRRNLAAARTHPQFQLVEGDIRDEELVHAVVNDDVDAVVHLAARAGVRPSIQQPLLYQDVNIRGTMVLLEAVRRRPGCRFIFASSSSVYGDNVKIPFSETDPVDHPISPYAATKRAGELLCHTYHHLHGLSVTCLRFFTVYGPRQRPDLAIHKFADLIDRDRPIPVYGDGTMERDFTYIDDIIDGVIRSIRSTAGYRLYNLGESEPVTVLHLISLLEEAMNRKAIVQYLPEQPGDVRRTCADIRSAREELGYQPRTSLPAGISRFVAWFRSERALGRR